MVRTLNVRHILDGLEEPWARYQNPRVETRADVARPYLFIRATVRIATAGGEVGRVRRVFRIGHVDEKLGPREIEKRRQAILAPINDGRGFLRSQFRFDALCQKFLDARLPQLGAAAANKYRSVIETHLIPSLGTMN